MYKCIGIWEAVDTYTWICMWDKMGSFQIYMIHVIMLSSEHTTQVYYCFFV